MKRSTKTFGIIYLLLLMAAAPRAAEAAQGRATASAQVISPTESALLDTASMTAAGSAATQKSTAGPEASRQTQVTESNGTFTVSIDFN
ncbi:hypothetical protein LPW11_02870 [Geomonas sp. RF6]|uniref:hypothetical protein n=1 Tax=Geomonas sp. RF6 TaxID=2897342 RepID=UPI001E4BBE52|nr:hypothetical protein [Geomonas sp. RF6]UFS71142.1 hypothetical protein LPW11_02870 [Geomonas sp. RF6]